ncbi:MAG: radical SAM protein [Candidatus Sumerlaeia bacterium]|nr:radical SAM protein [Candidatus Sumerlaeia bacterium]
MAPLAIDIRKLGRRIAEPLAYEFDASFVKPSVVSLSLTNRCNLRCPTCSYWKTPSSARDEELTTAEIVALMDKLRAWLGPHAMVFAGGEPFLRPDILQLYRAAAERGIQVLTVTNGSLLPEPRVKELRELASTATNPVHTISVSLNHLDRAKHDETRGVDFSAERIHRCVEQLNYPGRPFQLTLSTILMGFNIDHAGDMVRWVRERGLDGVTFQILYFESGNAAYEPRWYEQSPFWDNDADKINRGMDELEKLKRDGWPIRNPLDQLRWMRQYLLDPEQPIAIPCRVGVSHFDIDPNGDVRLCDVMEPVGNVRQSPPDAIWAGAEAARRRKEIHGCGAQCRIKSCNFRRPLGEVLRERLGA